MRLTQLRSFHAVARCGGFTAAARYLNISQSTVTVQVGLLEKSYGVELFHRQGRKVTLSQTGEKIYAIAQNIFSLETDAVHALRDAGELRTGILRVGAVGSHDVTEMLELFNERFPAIEVAVRLGNSESMIAALERYEADVAVLAGDRQPERFLFVPYRRHPVVAVMRRDHPLARKKGLAPADLAGVQMIRREEGSTTRKSFEEAMAKAGVAPDYIMEIGSREAIRECVARGIGIGVVSALEHVPHPHIRAVPFSGEPVFTSQFVVCLRERASARLVAAFLRIATELKSRRGQGEGSEDP